MDKKAKTKQFKKRLYNFVLKLIELIENLPKDRVCFIIIGDQLLRSGTSILSNYIAEQSASSKKDYLKYLEISLKSTNESKVWVCILRDRDKITKEQAVWFLDKPEEIGNIFASIKRQMQYLIFNMYI
ncbi:MAG: four helix bundle protein [Patescibacteria group bacterium]|nr:four helix bundle protein [Patescibacteria group bacterium]